MSLLPRVASASVPPLPMMGAVLLSIGHTSFADGQLVRGRLLEAGTERVVMLGAVALTDTTLTVVDRDLTDHAGRFTLRAPDPGAYLVVADGLGYQRRIDGILELGEGGYVEITFYLPTQPIEMAGIEVTVGDLRTRRSLVLAGFYERMERGGGHFVTPDDIERRSPSDPQDLLRGIPGVRVAESLGGQSVTCNGRSPVLWLDGARVAFSDLALTSAPDVVLEEVTAVEDIAALEVYRGPASTPARFTVTAPSAPAGSETACTIVVWTRR